MKNDKPERIPVTVVMRSYNDAAILPRTLAALDAQTGVEIALSVFESASTDGSPEILKEHGCARFHGLEPGSYRSSRVLNQGAREAETEVVVFLNSDAVLVGKDVLHRLASALLASEKTVGVYARQTTRADAGFMTRLEYEQAFERRQELGRAASWMTLVCSAIRRSAWEEIPFDERLTFAEDAVWSEAVAARGWETVYLADAAAEHSHEYNGRERYCRAFGDAAALAVLANSPKPRGLLSGMLIPWLKRWAKVSLRVTLKGQPWRIPQVALHFWSMICGAWRGHRAGWNHFHRDGGAGEQPLAK